MDEGALCQFGFQDKVYYQPRNLKVASLLGDYNVIKKADVESKSKSRIKKTIILRPHQLYVMQKPDGADLTLTNNSLYLMKVF